MPKTERLEHAVNLDPAVGSQAIGSRAKNPKDPNDLRDETQAVLDKVRNFVETELYPVEPKFLTGGFAVVLPDLEEKRFGEIADKRIRRGVFKSERELIDAIMSHVTNHNNNPQTYYTWTAKADDILKKVARLKGPSLIRSNQHDSIR